MAANDDSIVYRNLVFEGGGVKGIAYAGTLKIMEERKLLQNIIRVAGTSAGAITAAGVALGASHEQMNEILTRTDFRRFMDHSWFYRDIERLRRDYGWCKGDEFIKWIQTVIEGLLANETRIVDKRGITFKQLACLVEQDKTIPIGDPTKKYYRDLFIVGTNLTMQRSEVFSASSTPDMPIWLATRISMSMPLFFAAWKMQGTGHYYCDGGLSWNYPIDIFDSTQFLVDKENCTKPTYLAKRAVTENMPSDCAHVYNRETLGLKLDPPDSMRAEVEGETQPLAINCLTDFIGAFCEFTFDKANQTHLFDHDKCRTVFINSGTVKATEFKLSEEKIQWLLASGENAMKVFLATSGLTFEFVIV